MDGRFSFLGDDFESLFYFPGFSLPGVEQITGIYASMATRELKMVAWKKGAGFEPYIQELAGKPELNVTFQRQRSISLAYSWISRDELPFEVPVNVSSEPNLFSELENLVLVLRYRNVSDGKYDLLYLQVDPSPGSFGISKAEKGLTTEYKNIIGHIFYHYFKSILEFNRQNKELWGRLNQTVRALVRENLQIREESLQVSSNYGDSMVNLCQQYLQDITEKTGRQYVLSLEAEEKVRAFKGNVRHLDAIIQNAVLFTDNMLMSGDATVVSIEAFSLSFDDYQVTPMPEVSIRKIDSRESRTIQLLDKLEKGAGIVKAKNMALTSVNVGKSLPQPISAPAITDALKKHRKTIILLLDKFPEKWEIIRTEFKPLRNVLKGDGEEDREESNAV